MSAPEKAEVVTKVSSSPLPKRKVLRELGIPKSTYYRWLRRQDQQGLEDRPGGDQPPWNRLTIQEERSVLLSAREMPELSCRQLAAWVTDNQGFSVSESSVYRILGREGLVKRPEMRLAAGLGLLLVYYGWRPALLSLFLIGLIQLFRYVAEDVDRIGWRLSQENIEGEKEGIIRHRNKLRYLLLTLMLLLNLGLVYQ